MTEYKSSLDTSIKDELLDYWATVDSANDLHSKSKLWDGTNSVTVTNNKLDVNASVTSTDKWYSDVSAGKGFITTIDLTNITSGLETNFFLINNPNASGKVIKLYNIKMGLLSGKSVIRFYLNPTITTNGTALTINKLLTSGTASIASAYSAPTTSARGTMLSAIQIDFGQLLDVNYDLARFIQPNENLLISVDGSASGLDYTLSLLWEEE
jgi:hypothetical protein